MEVAAFYGFSPTTAPGEPGADSGRTPMAHDGIARKTFRPHPKGGSMSAIMIKCPNTDRDIFTGIETDFVSFNRLPNVLSHSYCPACDHEHPWRTAEAWLASHAAERLSTRGATPDTDRRK
jgi:hypothetical protein